MAIENMRVQDTVSFRLTRGDNRMETKNITIDGKSVMIQRVGNITMLSLISAGELSIIMEKLITQTVKEPVFTRDQLECLDPTEFGKLLEEVLQINQYTKFVDSLNKISLPDQSTPVTKPNDGVA
jgi:hypothetical protein